MDKISVIVPVYNREKAIEKCIHSIQAQTYKNIEIICVDDKSKDNSLQICYDLQKKDSRIIVCPLEKNGGVSHARNIGIGLATGEWIAFVDSDDTIASTMLEDMLNEANSCGASLVLSDIEEVKDGSSATYGIRLEAHTKYDSDRIHDEILPAFTRYGQENLILFSFSTKLYKSDVIKNNSILFDENIAYQEDKLFVIDAFAACDSCVYINRAYYRYEISSTGLYSGFKPQAWKWYVALYFSFIEKLKRYSIVNANVNAVYEDFAYNITWFLYRSRNIKDSRERKQLQNEVIHNGDVKKICSDIVGSLSSFEKRMIAAMLSGNRTSAMWLIKFVYSGKKDKVVGFVQKLLRRG